MKKQNDFMSTPMAAIMPKPKPPKNTGKGSTKGNGNTKRTGRSSK